MIDPTSARGDDVLNAVLIPVINDTLLLPNVAIADVIAPDGLRAAPAGAAPWFAGWIAWQGVELPVVRFEPLNGAHTDVANRRTRIIVLHPVGNALSAHRFGLVGDGHPHLLSVGRDSVKPLELRAGDDPELVLGRARAASQEALIPDLRVIEARLAQLLEQVAGTGTAATAGGAS